MSRDPRELLTRSDPRFPAETARAGESFCGFLRSDKEKWNRQTPTVLKKEGGAPPVAALLGVMMQNNLGVRHGLRSAFMGDRPRAGSVRNPPIPLGWISIRGF